METLRSGDREFAGDPSAGENMEADSRLPLRAGVGARGLTGHLELTCSRDEAGRSFLSHQSFSAPFHIGKAYWDDHSLRVQVVNPTAGFFSGDSAEVDVRVEAGAALQITTPSASRIHTMRGGRATLEQRFRVEAGGWLEFNPAPLIPQAGSSYRQRTKIDVAQGGEAFFLETLAPGRVARGEVFQFEDLDWASEVRLAGQLVSKERFRLRPHNGSLWALRHPFPVAYAAAGCLVTHRFSHGCEVMERLRALNSDSFWLGISTLVTGGWSLRSLAADSCELQAGKARIREIIGESIPAMGGVLRG